MRRVSVVIMVMVAALVLGACGGGDDSSSETAASSSSSTSSDQPDATVDVPDAASDDQTSSTIGSVGDVFDTAGGTATVTIGDETWMFELSEDIPPSNCDADFFGGFVAILTNPGADMANPVDLFSTVLPGGDLKETPSVHVNLSASGDAEWVADATIYEQNADLPAGLGVVDFSIDGTTASGSAVFFEQESFYQFNAGNGELVVADGTFTVTCVSSG